MRGPTSGTPTSVFRNTGFLYKQQLNISNSPYNNTIPAVLLAEGLRIDMKIVTNIIIIILIMLLIQKTFKKAMI